MSAASAFSGTVKPALRRPLGVSTNTRRRRCGIKLTITNGRGNGASGRRLERDHRMEWEPAPGLPERLLAYVGKPDYFPSCLTALLHCKIAPSLRDVRGGSGRAGPLPTTGTAGQKVHQTFDESEGRV
jgi:hypothetical protein